MASLTRAIEVIHKTYRVPHIVLTSVSLDTSTPSPSSTDTDADADATTTTSSKTLSVIGSTMTSTYAPRAFKIRFPAIDAYFSGTGDMFAALMVVRMREAVTNNAPTGKTTTREQSSSSSSSSSPSASPPLGAREAWLSDDGVDALDLPLARAAEKVLGTMHEVLDATCRSMRAEVRRAAEEIGGGDEKRMHLARSKAAELRLVRHLGSLREPSVEFRAQRM